MPVAVIRKYLRGLALWAMLVPFLMVALVARGVMPGRSAEGMLTVVLCTADSPVNHRIALDGGAPPPVGDGADHPCAHAQAHAAFTLPAAIVAPSRPVKGVALLGRVLAAGRAPEAAPRGMVMVRGPPRAG